MLPKRKASSPANVRASGLISPFRTSACRRPATWPTSSGGDRSATAPHQNTCPITAARWSTPRSSSPSLSRRAARTAWTVSGTRSESTAASGSSRPSRSTSTPSSTSIRSISSRKSGLPPVARPTASAASGSKRAGEVLQQRAGVLARKRRELDRRPRPRRPQLGQIRSRQAADEDRRVAAPAGQVLDEVEEGGLCPLDVVEHDDEGTLLRERLEQPAHGPVELVGARAWLGAADGLEDAPVRDLPVGLAAEHAVEVDVAHDLDEGPVGDPVPVRETAALEHLRFSGGRDQLGREPGLADAGLADDRDDPARTVCDRALELGRERVQLRGPADERRVEAARDACRVGLDLEQPPRVDGLGLALQHQGGHRLDGDGVADEPDRRVADEDLPRSGRRLEPLRDDDGVAGRERIAVRRGRRRRPRRCARRSGRRS